MNDHLRLCSLVTRWLRDEATGLATNKVYADGVGEGQKEGAIVDPVMKVVTG